MSDFKIEIRETDYGDPELVITSGDLNNVYGGDLEPSGFLWALNGCICGFPICCIVSRWKRASSDPTRRSRGKIGIQPLTREEFGMCRKQKHEWIS